MKRARSRRVTKNILDMNGFEQNIVQTAKFVEQQIDEELERINSVKLNDEDELEALKRKRIAQLKKQTLEKKKYELLGHGSLQNMTDHNQFFGAVKQSERVIAFFTNGSQWCELVEKHLKICASKHPETRFIRIDAEKAPVLVKHLNIWMMPTLVLIKEGKTEYSIVGLDDLNGTQVNSEIMTYIFSQFGVVNKPTKH